VGTLRRELRSLLQHDTDTPPGTALPTHHGAAARLGLRQRVVGELSGPTPVLRDCGRNVVEEGGELLDLVELRAGESHSQSAA
jgi:hypothetical protein